MWKRVIYAGLLGGIVFIVWTFVVNGIFQFNLRVNMKPVPDERRVYAVLKENIVVPGRYVCNPAVTKEGVFPLDEPVFAIQYGGSGHEAAGRAEVTLLALGFVVPLLAAGMLSVASDKILATYFRRVLYITAIGLLFVVSASATKSNIGGYPLHDTLLLAAYDVFTWLLLGLVIAWPIRRDPQRIASA